jgi:hypothetical protein
MAYHTAATKPLPEHQDAGLVSLLFKVISKQMADNELTNQLMEASSTTKSLYVN